MLPPEKIQALADPVESVYIHMVGELLVNIGKHVTSPTWTHTAEWEIKKLSELGQLTRENAAIINRWIKKIPEAVREAMTATRSEALDRIEKLMEQASEPGAITPAPRESTLDEFRDLSRQATDKFNLVNTNMLNSSVDMFTQVILDTARDVREAEAMEQDLLARAAATQEILNEAAANRISGAETREKAVRRAIDRISEEGLTGFIDRAGRHWTPEAYVNMVTRTTLHNVAIEATRNRMEDAGIHIFQYSSHAGARPLCYPIQGKFFSWTETEPGYFTDGMGEKHLYMPFNDEYVEGYGTPAGPFGINCRHYPIPIFEGISIPHGQDNIQSPEDNARTYAQSQEQRRLERQIRAEKRRLEMLGDMATAEDKARLQKANEEMEKFIERTGRTRRPDRERI